MSYQGHGNYTCDECPEDIATTEEDFDSRRVALQQAGWRTFKGPDGLWAHSCPSCTEDFAKRKKR